MSVIDRALAEITPAGERKSDCEQEIKRLILTLRLAEGVDRASKPPGVTRTALCRLEKALQAVKVAAEELPFPYGFDPKFLDRVERERQAVKNMLGRIVVAPGSPRRSYTKHHAVKFARELLAEYGQAPTLYESGPWPKLAALLYKGAFGVSADMFEYCRDYHNELTGRPRRKSHR